MRVTYAVSWKEPGGSPGSGRLELGAHALTLEGQNGSSSVSLAYRYRDISGVRVARAADDRLQDRPTLIVDLAGAGSLRIASVAQPGIVSELASRLSDARHDRRASKRLALVVPLKAGARSKAESLLAEGPPFDPATVGLEDHEVFLTDEEAVFVFEGIPSVLLNQAAQNETLWAAAEVWEQLLEGPIRFAARLYSWPD
ncbi:MAG TPA: hypothetical protein VIF36_04220 [Gaiellaceae bacterium]